MVQSKPTPAELRAWGMWTAFCDDAGVAPDTLHDAATLTARYQEQTGKRLSVAFVQGMKEAADRVEF